MFFGLYIKNNTFILLVVVVFFYPFQTHKTKRVNCFSLLFQMLFGLSSYVLNIKDAFFYKFNHFFLLKVILFSLYFHIFGGVGWSKNCSNPEFIGYTFSVYNFTQTFEHKCFLQVKYNKFHLKAISDHTTSNHVLQQIH